MFFWRWATPYLGAVNLSCVVYQPAHIIPQLIGNKRNDGDDDDDADVDDNSDGGGGGDDAADDDDDDDDAECS